MAGIGFPMQLDTALGRFRIPDEAEEIRQSVHLILTTRRGERPFRPDFGTQLERFVFESPDETARNLIRQEVVSALHTWEDRIKQIEVHFEQPENQMLIIHVAYTIKANGATGQVHLPLGAP